MKSRAEKHAFVRMLEGETEEEVMRQLRMLSMDELCAINEFASRRLRDLIHREMRMSHAPGWIEVLTAD